MNIKADPLTRDSIWAPPEDLNVLDTMRKSRETISKMRQQPNSTIPPSLRGRKVGPKADRFHMMARLKALAIQRNEYRALP